MKAEAELEQAQRITEEKKHAVHDELLRKSAIKEVRIIMKKNKISLDTSLKIHIKKHLMFRPDAQAFLMDTKLKNTHGEVTSLRVINLYLQYGLVP